MNGTPSLTKTCLGGVEEHGDEVLVLADVGDGLAHLARLLRFRLIAPADDIGDVAQELSMDGVEIGQRDL
jgi:hypothetical protein